MAQYQSFDVPNISHLVAGRTALLRAQFQKFNIDGYIVPRADAFQGEYVPEAAERLSYITGFTGSWGLSLIMDNRADLYIDSRYKIQAPEQTDLDVFDVVCVSDSPLTQRLAALDIKAKKIGFDPLLFTKAQIQRYQEASGAEFIPLSENLVDASRTEIPEDILSDIIIHPFAYAGEEASIKIDNIVKEIEKKNADALIVALPESICWLLNVRGNDVPHTPFILARGILTAKKEFFWYVGHQRITKEIKEHLPENVIIKNPEEFWQDINNFKNKVVICDPDDSSYRVEQALEDLQVKIIKVSDPILLAKAIKNETEQNATQNAHIRDALAVIKFSHWYENQKGGAFTEIDCVNSLEAFRAEASELKDISFDTISGAGENGAIVHYRVTHDSNRTIQETDLFLCDSGGQYYDGTTDITRCFIIGTPTDEMKIRYTQVLKGHLAVANAVFPRGTTGAALDPLARQPLWNVGIDYGHGTGHGVGLYLSVHEGPQSISSRSTIILQEGMLLSNEPGYYKEGEFGIRIENVEMVVKKEMPKDAEKEILGFETLTLVPYERKLIDISLLTEQEIHQINDYHEKIYKKIASKCDENLKKYLKEKCKSLNS